MTYEVTIDGAISKIEIKPFGSGWSCMVNGSPVNVDAVFPLPDAMSLLIDGCSYQVRRETRQDGLNIWVGNQRYDAQVRDPRAMRPRCGPAADAAGPQQLKAPMPGKVVRIMVAVGSEVEAGQGVIVVEAMKMQNELRSPKKGIIRKIAVSEGASVNPGDVLLVVE